MPDTPDAPDNPTPQQEQPLPNRPQQVQQVRRARTAREQEPGLTTARLREAFNDYNEPAVVYIPQAAMFATQTEPPPPPPQAPEITADTIRLVSVRVGAAGQLALGFTHPAFLPVPYNVEWFPDVRPRDFAMSKAAMEAAARHLQAALNIPPPPRLEFTTPTIGERMYNLLGVLIEKGEFGHGIQNEWSALREEYEGHAMQQEGRRRGL